MFFAPPSAAMEAARQRQQACFDLFPNLRTHTDRQPDCTAVSFVTRNAGMLVVFAPNSHGIHGAAAASRIMLHTATALRNGGDISCTAVLPEGAAAHEVRDAEGAANNPLLYTGHDLLEQTSLDPRIKQALESKHLQLAANPQQLRAAKRVPVQVRMSIKQCTGTWQKSQLSI